ncbi:MAG: hypothetical protein QXE05_03225, partial [Nitrososphaeria archaeon]
MSKIKATIILTLLLATIFTPLLTFVPVAQASTGWIRVPSPDVHAGEYILLNFTEVTWSGTQFLLFWSTDGFSQINSTSDIRMITQPISVSLFSLPYPQEVEIKANSYFYSTKTITIKIGTNTEGQKVLEVPIPEKNTAGGAHFIKAFDGIAAQVAVSEEINVLPTLKLSPESGPGGRLVTLEGVALEANALVNITYTTVDKAFKQIETDNMGYFKYSWNIKELKIEFFGEDLLEDWAQLIEVSVYYNETEDLVGTVTFKEFPRAIYQLGNREVDWKESDWPEYGFGNETLYVDVYIGDEIIIAGNYFNPTDNATIIFDPTGVNKLLVEVPVNASGFFNTTFTVPIAAKGEYEVAIFNGKYSWVFYLNILPTLVLKPKQGPVGTIVNAEAYGFPEKIAVYIYWFEIEYGDGTYYWMTNATTGANGQFNVTVTFTVPHTYGGVHKVWAVDEYLGKKTTDISGTEIAEKDFKVLPTLEIVPSTFANDGSLVTVLGTGFDPTVGYTPNIDNRLLGVDPQNWDYPSSVYCNSTGDIELQFVAAGFTPGTHVFSLYAGGKLKPIFVLFTVTGYSSDTQVILSKLDALDAKLVAINGTLAVIDTKFGPIMASLDALDAKLVAINGTLAVIDTKFGPIMASLDALDAKLVAINGTLAVIDTKFGPIMASLDALSTQVVTMSSTLNSIKDMLSSGLKDIRTDISSVKSDLATLSDSMSKGFTSVNNAIGTLTTSVGNLGNTLSGQITNLGNTLSKSIS